MQTQVEINEKEVLRQMMIFYPYREFAQMIAEVVKQADEPQELASLIAYEMRCI